MPAESYVLSEMHEAAPRRVSGIGYGYYAPCLLQAVFLLAWPYCLGAAADCSQA